jgi:hypothetical protein
MDGRLGLGMLAIAAIAVACGHESSGPASPSAATTYLSLQGGQGHPLLRGQSRRFTVDQASFSAGVDCYENHMELKVSVLPDQWTISLGAPRGQRLIAGTYVNASRHPFNMFSDRPGIRVAGEGRGCDDIGWFVVTDARYRSSGAIERFRATFEHRCERFPDPLLGEVELISPPGGQVSCP